MSSAAASALDIWHYYGNKNLSDVTIVLAEEEPATDAEAAPPVSTRSSTKRKREEGEHIVGHGVVLAGFSGYCRTKLEDWDHATGSTDQNTRRSSSGNSSAKREIQMPVPAGQLEVGQLLIRSMYQQQPDLSDVSQVQLVQLLLLADRYEVPKVQAAVSAAFRAMPLDELQWETVMAVYGLPAGCAELAACKDLFSAAAGKLQHELGDLELVLTHPQGSKRQQLVKLPFAALKQLLQDKRTRVSSENTVFCAVQWWYEWQKTGSMGSIEQQQQQQQRQGACSTGSNHLTSWQQQAKELLQLVRMPHCSQLFIATVIGNSELATSCFSTSDLLLASSINCPAAGTRWGKPFPPSHLPALQKYPAWLLPKRPASAMTALIIDLKLPLSELKEAFDKHLQSGKKESQGLYGAKRQWRGLVVYPEISVGSSSSGGIGGSSAAAAAGGDAAAAAPDEAAPVTTSLGFYAISKLAPSAARGTRIGYIAKGFNGAADVEKGSGNTNLHLYKCNRWGHRSFVKLGAVNSWSEMEAALRNQGLVGPDGCLHLTMIVNNVL